MSPALNLLSNNLQVYGPSTLPCLGVSGRAVGVSPCPQSQRRTLHMSVTSPNCYLRHKFFVCKARFGGQGRDSDFSRQNKHGFSRSWAWLNDERGDSDDLGESEILSAKNEQLPSLSNSEKHHGIASPRPRNREIEEQNKEIEKNDSLLWFVEEKLAVDQEKRRADISRRYRDLALQRARALMGGRTLMVEVYGKKELDEKSGETHSEPDLGAEAQSDSELDMDLNSGLELDQEEDEEEELEAAVQSETDPVNVRTAEEDNLVERLTETFLTEGDLTARKLLDVLKLDELREFARIRGIEGYSELPKSELLELLCADAM